MAEKSDEILFETKDMSKFFGPTVALNKVSLSVKRGEILGLIGENGSGKSTISSIAAGIQPASEGEMFLRGEAYSPSSMVDGTNAGVGMIVQESGVVSSISVAENIFLGQAQTFRKFLVVNKKKMYEESKLALQTIGMENINPKTPMGMLDMEQRKLIEVAKVMYHKPDLLMVDETTTALSQHGRDILYKLMDKQKAENKSVMFISHDLEELMEHCDRLVVLRDGKYIASVEKEDFEPEQIKQYMVGREVSKHYYREDFGKEISDEVVLKVEDLTTAHGLLQHFSMELHKGEIVGIGGLSHCGMHELAKGIFGDAPLLGGKVTHVASGETITSQIIAMKHGLGYVSKDRDKEALVLTASIKDNIVSAGLDKLKNKLGLIGSKKERRYVQKQIDSLSIKCSDMEQAVQYLSGGNKQKVVFGKWVGRQSDILILDCPTRGVDIGVKQAMYQLMEDMIAEGKSIILISEELSELIGMSDRLIILKDGKESAQFMRSPELEEGMIINAMI
ncbi:MAG: sugar ABC transporter ATP-binding protein [Lachnospiraceae bacterium]|nr:sugar ABC transporter ATP-binding protein [Lachnospiraceae bacterium]